MAEHEEAAAAPAPAPATRSPTEFLRNVISRAVIVKLNSGVVYRGVCWMPARLFGCLGPLLCTRSVE